MTLRVRLIAGLLTGFGFGQASADDPISYDRQIRPILSKNCFACHGPDAEARKADLRLDVHGAAISVHDGHAAIVPGKPDESDLVHRITSADPENRMPPPESEKTLSEEEITLVREWILQGAEWSSHWAFTPPQRPAKPQTLGTDWARNPIDAFVLSRLEKEGLQPSLPADRETLLRRVSLDLTGLLPPLEVVDAVLADPSDHWYENLIDRLLASPHYGERWARHWMDAAQYADSDGFEKDKPRQVWAWRDWVIKAFNEDLPFDQFIVEQVAGDMLPDATQDQIVATGFLRNSMINEEGGIDPEQFRMEALFNRMEIVGRAVLGVTVQCAQCHTHKYDPITHTDYFRMLAFLNNSAEACDTVYSQTEQEQRAKVVALIDEIEADVKKSDPDWREEMAAWEAIARTSTEPAWKTVSLTFDDSSVGGQKHLPREDGSYVAQGYAPTQFHPKMTGKTDLQKVTAVRLDLLSDANLPRGGPGRSIYGACALSEFEMRVAPEGTSIAEYDKWTPVKIASAIADVNPRERTLGSEFPLKEERKRVTGSIEMAIDGKHETAWTTDIDPARRNQARYAIFRLAEPLTIEPGTVIAFRLSQLHGGWNSDDNQNNNLGRFRISLTDADALPEVAIPAPVRAALALDQAARTEPDNRTLFSYWRTTEQSLEEVSARIDALWQAVPSGATQLVLHERETPRTTHRLDRGDFLHPAEEVQPGVPAFLNPLVAEGTPDRLDFARWLVSRESPTTARAYVNRVWQHYFGEGLTATTSDLGTQGEPPSHPDLLDWLSVEFMDSGWSIKQLHRLILTSATYKQASTISADLLERDPYNRMLARATRYRVEGETVRDIALAASGLLNTTVGGPSVYPPAPEFLFQPPASYGPKIWATDHGANQYRRGLYTFRFRSVPYPALQAFDAPAGDAPCTRRVRSNTPIQALTLLNEPLFFDCARGLAETVLDEGGQTDRSRIEYAFRRCATRRPVESEVAVLEQFLAKQRARIAAGELSPDAILGAESGGARDRGELVAWTLVARTLLNLDETISRQ
ncbi:MAG: PSD1 and planctomycete cytochrome C domain-containing protein [Candidatus Hydrogenedentes bacterium]|nr:PSD1 and planctomycete cytochrome C domain-containing protein [Candidatus Hydrogenedentota bacterium]